jgi:hypothetical protein
MGTRIPQRGLALVLVCLVLVAGVGTFLAAALAAQATGSQRERITARALAKAREALIAHAADRPINAAVGPGYLPCPDADNDGWAESTCGSLNGDSGQAARLGRLPWKTLGLGDLRDAHGERLWYAVSTRFKGLLNCAASAACLDMTPASARGTLTVRDPSGARIHDGTSTDAVAGGAVAVLLAPGPPLVRLAADGSDAAPVQGRACAPGECDALGRCLTDPPQRAAPCDPRNYLDRAPGGEDNADFIDRSDAAGRARNANGFIHGPVLGGDGRIAVNDRIAVVAVNDVMPRVMKRVALEVAHCLRFYASRPENAGRYPHPRAACARGPRFGTVPDAPFDEAQAASGGGMLARWWRVAARVPENLAELPTREDACRIAVPPDDPGPARTSAAGATGGEALTVGALAPSWWNAWKPQVFYALARGYASAPPQPAACRQPADCLQLVDATGVSLGGARAFALIVSSGCPDDATCGGEGACERITVDARTGNTGHAIVAFP